LTTQLHSTHPYPYELKGADFTLVETWFDIFNGSELEGELDSFSKERGFSHHDNQAPIEDIDKNKLGQPTSKLEKALDEPLQKVE
jgi:hypothetical protein